MWDSIFDVRMEPKRHEINASITAFPPFCVLKVYYSGNEGIPLCSYFSTKIFPITFCITESCGLLYGQAQDKNMACSRPREEVEWTRQICTKEPYQASAEADPGTWKPFLSFSFPSVPLSPERVLRTPILRDAQHGRGLWTNEGGTAQLWAFRGSPGLQDLTEKPCTKGSCSSW